MSTAIESESGTALTAVDIATAAQLACLLEVSAPKPGNVSPGRHFGDLRYEDFLASAVAIGGPLAGVAERPLGATIRLAVEATAGWAPSNTNLGLVLLLAPLARAAQNDTRPLVLANQKDTRPLFPAISAQDSGVSARDTSPKEMTPDPFLRAAVREVLEATTVADAREVYAAIRLAAPGGLGQVAAQDVAG